MISMTGYGYKEYQDDKVHFSLEMKSCNNRYLDISMNLPSALSPLEGALREILGSRLRRGRVDVFLRMREGEEDLILHIDEKAVLVYARALEKIRTLAGVKSPLSLGDLLSMEGLVKIEKKRDLEIFLELLKPLFREVLEQLCTSRVKEGASTEKDIMEHIALLKEYLDEVKGFAPKVEEQITRTLKNKFREVLGDALAEDRILAEVAVQIVRFDINEEIKRLDCHLDSFKAIAAADEGMGKKLDFLCQEMGREINTIGSKGTMVEISRLVVKMKDALEKIREQLRNVE